MVTAITYPPQIEGKIPAQYGNILRIPFSSGYAPTSGTVMRARLKSIVGNDIIGNILQTSQFEELDGETLAIFAIENNLLEKGQYYKIQLAWDNDTIYSTIGIFRYTSTPSVVINELNSYGVSEHLERYYATYTNDDAGEKPYKYRFLLLKNSEIIESSGLQECNINESGILEYCFNTNLLDNQLYIVQCLVYTTGGLTVRSPMYLVKKIEEYHPQVQVQIQALGNAENGSIIVSIAPLNNAVICGKYRILRASSINNFKTWDELANIEININSSWQIFEDKTVQQGINYKYAIQQYNANIYTSKVETNMVTCNFEDMFLFDGKRQLKIRFNPKVANFKTVNLEQKVETIGSPYPFIFRNGYTKYKEFSISGLISLLIDENGEFIQKSMESEVMRSQTPSSFTFLTDLTNDNFCNERQFKLAVLDWLTDGKPKLFRSPAEGNYIVRLMNTSLTPNDTLGRMLHTFTSTAYEIAPYNYKSLLSYGLAQTISNKLAILNYSNINLTDYREVTTIPINQGKTVIIREATPGAEFSIWLKEQKTPITITVGTTGYYQYNAYEPNIITGITINPRYAGIVDIAQYGLPEYPIMDSFNDTLQEVVSYQYDERFLQFYHEDEAQQDVFAKACVNNANGGVYEQITKIAVLHVEGRPIITTQTLPREEDRVLTYIYQCDDGKYFGNGEKINSTLDYTLNISYSTNDEDRVEIDLSPQILNEKSKTNGRIIYTSNEDNVFLPQSISIGNGLIVHMYYAVRHTQVR